MSKKISPALWFTILFVTFVVGILVIVAENLSKTQYNQIISWRYPTDPVERARYRGELPETMPSVNTLRAYILWKIPQPGGDEAPRGRLIPEPLTKQLGEEVCHELATFALGASPVALFWDPWLRGCVSSEDVVSFIRGTTPSPDLYGMFERRLWTHEAIVACLQERPCAKLAPSLFSEGEISRALEHAKSRLKKFDFIPMQYWTRELAKFAVEQDVRNFKHVPEHFRTYPFSLHVVQVDGRMLEFVPRGHKLANGGYLCKVALEQSDGAEPFVPSIFRHKFP